MKITVPFLYTFQYIPTRCQNYRDARALAHTEIEIAEIDDGDAPVVMTVANRTEETTLFGAGHKRFMARPDGTPRNVRMRNGLFYVEGDPVEDFAVKAMDLHSINGTFLGAYTLKGGRKEPGYGRYDKGGAPTTIHQVRRANGGLREEHNKDDRGAGVAGDLAAQAAKMFIIDGVVYERCREPVLAIAPPGTAEDATRKCGIAEAPENLSSRKQAYYGAFLPMSCSSSLVHARHLLAAEGIDDPGVGFDVLDPDASGYDGVASDILYHATKALDALEGATAASSSVMLRAYYRLKDAVRHSGDGMAVVGGELLASLREVISVVGDPDIDDPMEEMGKARYSNYQGTYRKPVDLDKGLAYGLGLHRAAEYRESKRTALKAAGLCAHALERWERRHHDAVFDREIAHRPGTFTPAGLAVTELNSASQTRCHARFIGVPDSQVNMAVEAGARVFAVTGRASVSSAIGPAARAGIVALVLAPAEPGADWQLANTDHPLADRALDAVGDHIEAMDDLADERSRDQQPIAIF